MSSKFLVAMILFTVLVISGTSQSQGKDDQQDDRGSVDHLKTEDFAPKTSPEQTKPKKAPGTPAPPSAPRATGEAPIVDEHSPGEAWREPVVGIEFVWVPGGCYQMGCGSWTSDCWATEKPVHEVCVDGFWIGKYEVTQGQWQKVMAQNPAFFRDSESFPVANISWNDVQEFIRKLKDSNGGKYEFRLPTEGEWEYACRSGGAHEKFSGGDNAERVAWFKKNTSRSPNRVGTKQPNGMGIYDMSGNVWELCEDVYDDSAYAKHQKKNPVIRSGGVNRVIRGGAWHGGKASVRCAVRSVFDPVSRRDRVGLRLVRKD